jgi:hypothetical protein
MCKITVYKNAHNIPVEITGQSHNTNEAHDNSQIESKYCADYSDKNTISFDRSLDDDHKICMIGDCKSDSTLLVHVDYFGNIYLKYHSDYYIVSLDHEIETGIELTKIRNQEIFRKQLEESKHVMDNIKSGIIRSEKLTLAGKAHNSLNAMNDEEKVNFLELNEFMSHDEHYNEKKFFWVNYKKNIDGIDDADSEDEYLDDDGEKFYLNGMIDENELCDCNGMIYSDMLALSAGSFETILINGNMASKNVISNTEKIDGHCTSRLTIYSSGHFRSNFIDRVKVARVFVDETGDLFMKKL